MRTSNLPLPAWPLHALKKASARIKLPNQQLHLCKLQEQRPASTRISPATLRLHGMQFNNWHRLTPRNGQRANRTERAAKRIQRAIRKKQVHAQASPQASAFRLDPSVWLGMDEMSAQLLEKVELHATGIYFTDVQDSSREDLALWEGIHSDALRVVFLGHTCPDPSTCSGPVMAPAFCRSTLSKHFLACCHHQVGSTPIRPTFTAQALFAALRCRRMMCPKTKKGRTSCKDQCVRSRLHLLPTASPKPFQVHGADHTVAGGKPSAPHLCDSFLFRGKVPSSLLPVLLQKSGFNHVYMVPRNHEDRPLNGRRIVWLSTSMRLNDKPPSCPHSMAL